MYRFQIIYQMWHFCIRFILKTKVQESWGLWKKHGDFTRDTLCFLNDDTNIEKSRNFYAFSSSRKPQPRVKSPLYTKKHDIVMRLLCQKDWEALCHSQCAYWDRSIQTRSIHFQFSQETHPLIPTIKKYTQTRPNHHTRKESLQRLQRKRKNCTCRNRSAQRTIAPSPHLIIRLCSHRSLCTRYEADLRRVVDKTFTSYVATWKHNITKTKYQDRTKMNRKGSG